MLAAARTLFTQRGFNEVGIRALAAAADATPAMIHYYFGDKEGLYVAMLEDAIGTLLVQLRDLAVSPSSADPIRGFLQLYIGTLARDPWIPRLLIREVLAEGAPFRERFINEFASPAAKFVPTFLRKDSMQRRLRKDLDPVLATLSLIGMAAFPFIAYPVVSRVYGIQINEEFRERFIAHTAQLFLHGAARGGS